MAYKGNLKNTVGGGKWNVILIILALIAAYWIFHLWHSANADKKPDTANAPVNITVSSVTTEDMPNSVNLVGTVYAYETVALKSRIDSQIVSVHFKDGDAVREGQVLFELDDSLINAQLTQYRANLKRDEAQLENASKQYTRYLKLSAKGFASGEKMEDAAAAFKTATATVNATKASIENVRAQFDFTKITAPISGRAGTINVTRGNTVKANDTQPLVTINRVQPIRIQFAIPQRYYDAIRKAKKNEIKVVAKRSTDGEEMDTGKLEYIDNIIDVTTGSFNARALFENANEKLWPGMFVGVVITLNIDKNAIVIPQVAVQNGQDGDYVFMVDQPNKKAIKKKIEVMRYQDNKAVISSGLQLGELVAIDGMLKLNDGSHVEFISPEK